MKLFGAEVQLFSCLLMLADRFYLFEGGQSLGTPHVAKVGHIAVLEIFKVHSEKLCESGFSSLTFWPLQ